MKIIKAGEEDHQELTRIAFAAKRHWQYPEAYYAIWKDELTITPRYIRENDVYVILKEDKIAGFYSIVKSGSEVSLDHIFIDPCYHKQGCGTVLIRHAVQTQRYQGVKELVIYVDPNAAGFYDKIGALQTGLFQSNIRGRLIPVYKISL